MIFDGTRDTLNQISNTSNSMAHATCFYINAAPICLGIGDCLLGTCSGSCAPQWQEIDFSIFLTKQQPTHWTAGFGRFTNPLDVPCDRNMGNFDCDGAGIDPGRIPPVSEPFTSELLCIEVDQSGAPIRGNHLKGEATIVTPDGDASKYNAVAILGEPFTNDGNNILCLNGGETELCPIGPEYEGCPAQAIVNHFAEGADSLVLGSTSEVHTELTIVPCAADLERQIPTRMTIHFSITNEFEQFLSAVTTVECWRSFFLSDVNPVVFDVTIVGTRFLQTRIRPAGEESSFVGVVEEVHIYRSNDGGRARF